MTLEEPSINVRSWSPEIPETSFVLCISLMSIRGPGDG